MHNVEGVRQSFADASSACAHAGASFDPDVRDALSSKKAWSGDGSDEAKSVAETNSTAFAAYEAVANTAQLALEGFRRATDHARKRVEDAVLHPDTLEDLRAKAERRVKGYLAFATIADRSCGQVIDGLQGLMPNTTDYYDPDALAANRRALAGALKAQSLARLTAEFWRDAKPKALPEGKDGKHIAEITLDMIDIAGCSAGVVAALGADFTGVGAVLGVAAGAASLEGLFSSFQELEKDANKKEPKNKTDPPRQADRILDEIYEHGKVSRKTIDDHAGASSFTPNSPDTNGEAARPGERQQTGRTRGTR